MKRERWIDAGCANVAHTPYIHEYSPGILYSLWTFLPICLTNVLIWYTMSGIVVWSLRFVKMLKLSIVLGNLFFKPPFEVTYYHTSYRRFKHATFLEGGVVYIYILWCFHLFPIVPPCFLIDCFCFCSPLRPSFRLQAIQLPPSLSVDVSRSCSKCPWTLWQWQCLEATTCGWYVP